jgi:thioredoxin-like negative regulator of GroEL
MIAPVLKKAVENQQGKVLLVKVNVDDNNQTAGSYQVHT